MGLLVWSGLLQRGVFHLLAPVLYITFGNIPASVDVYLFIYSNIFRPLSLLTFPLWYFLVFSILNGQLPGWRGGLVVERRTCDLGVAGSRPGRDVAAQQP